MFRAKKSGYIAGFNTLRRNYQQLVKHEKRQSFNSYLEETAQSKVIQKFYDVMKTLNPKIKWNVNTGSTREESKAKHLVEIEKDPSYAGLHECVEAQKTGLECEVRCPDPSYFSIIEWDIVVQSLKTGKVQVLIQCLMKIGDNLTLKWSLSWSKRSVKQSPQEISIRNGSGSM
jgi:hypothetical protein